MARAMKKPRYVGTCAGGQHHKFQDADTAEITIMTIAEMDAAKIKTKADKDENDDFEQNLPGFLKNR